MSQQEREQLDKLLKIAAEAGTPLTDWEQRFVKSLDAKRQYALSDRQAESFDKIVAKHF